MQPGVKKKNVLKSGVLSEVVCKVAVIDLGFERTWDFWGERVGRTKIGREQYAHRRLQGDSCN